MSAGRIYHHTWSLFTSGPQTQDTPTSRAALPPHPPPAFPPPPPPTPHTPPCSPCHRKAEKPDRVLAGLGGGAVAESGSICLTDSLWEQLVPVSGSCSPQYREQLAARPAQLTSQMLTYADVCRRANSLRPGNSLVETASALHGRYYRVGGGNRGWGLEGGGSLETRLEDGNYRTVHWEWRPSGKDQGRFGRL